MSAVLNHLFLPQSADQMSTGAPSVSLQRSSSKTGNTGEWVCVGVCGMFHNYTLSPFKSHCATFAVTHESVVPQKWLQSCFDEEEPCCNYEICSIQFVCNFVL